MDCQLRSFWHTWHHECIPVHNLLNLLTCCDPSSILCSPNLPVQITSLTFHYLLWSYLTWWTVISWNCPALLITYICFVGPSGSKEANMDGLLMTSKWITIDRMLHLLQENTGKSPDLQKSFKWWMLAFACDILFVLLLEFTRLHFPKITRDSREPIHYLLGKTIPWFVMSL